MLLTGRARRGSRSCLVEGGIHSTGTDESTLLKARGEPVPLAILVEDNQLNRKLLRDILEIRFDVLEAETAERALELLEVHVPDLMVVDLQLPGMDGLTLMRLVKEAPATAAVPVVAISAHAMQEDINQALNCGCVEYVTKPLIEDPFVFVDRMARLATRRH